MRSGAPPDELSRYGSELEAVRAALEWARPGDLVLLTVHAERAAVIALVQRRATLAGAAPAVDDARAAEH